MTESDFKPVGEPFTAPVEDAPAKAEKRGRPRKYANDAERKRAARAREKARKQEAAGDIPEIAELRKAYADAKETAPEPDPVNGPETPAPEPVAAPMGHALLSIADTLGPLLVGRAMRRDPARIRLTNDEKQRLEPLADAAAEKVLAKTDPVKLFFVTLISIYTAKAQVLPKLERAKSKP